MMAKSDERIEVGCGKVKKRMNGRVKEALSEDIDGKLERGRVANQLKTGILKHSTK